MIQFLAAAFAAGALMAGAAAWTYQGNKYERIITEAQATAERQAREQERAYEDRIRQAQTAAQARAHRDRVDAAAARDAADRLRNDLDAAIQTSRDTPTACPVTAAALADVLRTVEAEGRGLAQTCDAHVNDLRTLMQSWPGK